MRRTLASFLLSAGLLLPAAKPLQLYFVDVEGGQATLIVTPAGQSLLVDTGWPGNSNRDALRIAEAAKKAGIKAIDYVLITHHHLDHVGGAQQLAAKMTVKTFIDHGPNVETSKSAKELDESYAKAIANSQHLVVKAGDTLPLKGVSLQFVTANGEGIAQPLAGAGQSNAACAATQPKAADPTENARSVGFILTYNKFRFADFGDLTWNKEIDLVCPQNKIGPVDLYLSTHHGMDISNAPPILDALRPRVAVMNNGARKGGSPAAWDTIKNSPGKPDLWQVHFAVAGGTEHNSPDPLIANTEENCGGHWLSATVDQAGALTLYNSRNKYMRTYPPAK